ncbi:hypothetical protein [Salinicoccus sp. Marseille-QA3877]
MDNRKNGYIRGNSKDQNERCQVLAMKEVDIIRQTIYRIKKELN